MLFPSPPAHPTPHSPLPVLVQAVHNGVPLLNDGHQLLHQHLLPPSVLVGPVLLYPAKPQERTGNYMAEGSPAQSLLPWHVEGLAGLAVLWGQSPA